MQIGSASLSQESVILPGCDMAALILLLYASYSM